MSVIGPGKVEIKCEENPDGTTRVSYKPTEPGQYELAVKYADEHVPGDLCTRTTSCILCLFIFIIISYFIHVCVFFVLIH